MRKHIVNKIILCMDNSIRLSTTEDAAVVQYVQQTIMDAIQKGASDIHFEPYEKHYRIRIRIDGLLYEIATPATQFAIRLTARIKIMAQLDIAERRLPQDGRFKLQLATPSHFDFRVSTCPTVNGEKIVIRILNPDTSALTINTLGLEPAQETIFHTALNKPHGMILVTGPTGSGKTVTLYSALNKLNLPVVNISTVEDPVEIYLAGINQVNVNSKIGLNFANVLRAFLRQDPDIIMVGEMRDLETAEIGIQAAQTGHLVLSTLHTNSAAETLTRLLNIGVPHYNIATSISLIVAQRLARRLCDHCKTVNKIPAPELFNLTIYVPVGCQHCTQGYKGRIGIFELLPITEKISAAILQNNSTLAISKQAQLDGMQILRDNGLSKVKQGITSLEEINRVTKL
jgi:type IV pilus assembly protein PilB